MNSSACCFSDRNFDWVSGIISKKFCGHLISVIKILHSNKVENRRSQLLFESKCRKKSIIIFYNFPVFSQMFKNQNAIPWSMHWTIYSATTFLERCRKVVREKWLEKSGSRNLVQEKWLTRKKIRVWRTTFLEPLFYTFLEKRLTGILNHLFLWPVTLDFQNFWWPRQKVTTLRYLFARVHPRFFDQVGHQPTTQRCVLPVSFPVDLLLWQ